MIYNVSSDELPGSGDLHSIPAKIIVIQNGSGNDAAMTVSLTGAQFHMVELDRVGDAGVCLTFRGEHEAAAFLEAMTHAFIRFYGEARLPRRIP